VVVAQIGFVAPNSKLERGGGGSYFLLSDILFFYR
jgi:hypothetical protein